MKNYLFSFDDLNCKFLTFGYKIEIRFFFLHFFNFFLLSQLEKRKKNGRNSEKLTMFGFNTHLGHCNLKILLNLLNLKSLSYQN